ncbi:indole-3-glycerol phosphate synthase TrpC [Candidatus Marinamargulisbacteria bacterium SCGC AG-414-C22]|nr:indole-3-glycerol phosphate synthase TrpC [Candidatus Marinamargulisbacteria bacterium SCGC AG-414-C22]
MTSSAIPSVLNEIIAYKKEVVLNLYNSYGISYFKENIEKNNTSTYNSVSFFDALSSDGLNLIAEIKQASPSKGIINAQFEPLSLAATYVSCGAKALSVLTDEKYFKGSNDILTAVKQSVAVPVLRKDFLVDPIQIYEAKSIGADAVLLILDILSVKQCQEFIDLAALLSLDVLLEIHDRSCIDKLFDLTNVHIIGINNRNLHDFSLDLEHSKDCYRQLKSSFSDSLFVAESGYFASDQCHEIAELGFNGVLIGEGLVTSTSLQHYFGDHSHED